MENMTVSEHFWNMKYRLKDIQGEPVDKTIKDTWKRVAKALASVETDKKKWEKKFYSIMDDYKFLPAGRILTGAGTNMNVTLHNCYVMGNIPDNMEGILNAVKEAGLTMQQGGGIGYDFSTIRPKGSLVKRIHADASGPVSFMNIWDSMCRTIMSAGVRRGAMMATLRDDHPDIEEFVEAKSDPNLLRMFNVSVLVSDKFMSAVENDGEWNLKFDGKVHKTIMARDLWDKILRSTYDYAEPGVIFIDRINEMNNLNPLDEVIYSTNPCSEQPLPPYGACLLGSVNLTKFVNNPFSESHYAMVQWSNLHDTVKTAVRMLDNVNDVSNYPLDAQREEALQKRRIGLGITGLADMLYMTNNTYGDKDAVYITSEIMRKINENCYETSVELAKEKGPCPILEKKSAREKYVQSNFIKDNLPHLIEDIIEHGIRNTHLTSIAPTGTISLYAGNVSSGIEPVFAHSYTRKVLQKDGSRTEQTIMDYACALWNNYRSDPYPQDIFVTAQDLTVDDHIKMQEAVQKHVDSAVSKTINIPEDYSFEDFKQVYTNAFDSGLKGCTTYRPNDVTGSVLSVTDTKKTNGANGANGNGLSLNVDISKSDTTSIFIPSVLGTTDSLRERPDELAGKTFKLKWPHSEHAIYVTVNDIVEEDGGHSPFEIFINSKDMAYFPWALALTRMISAIFRRGGDVSFVIEELKAVHDPKGGSFMKINGQSKWVTSIPAAIAHIIDKHLKSINYAPVMDTSSQVVITQSLPADSSDIILCPKCNSEMSKGIGCATCLECGYSKCD